MKVLKTIYIKSLQPSLCNQEKWFVGLNLIYLLYTTSLILPLYFSNCSCFFLIPWLNSEEWGTITGYLFFWFLFVVIIYFSFLAHCFPYYIVFVHFYCKNLSSGEGDLYIFSFWSNAVFVWKVWFSREIILTCMFLYFFKNLFCTIKF